jgi:acetolactate synthase-1/2/3 large subunit
VPMPNPLALGFIGRNGTYPANQTGRHCDLLIAVGARFDDRSSSSWIPGYSWNIPPTNLVHVDIDPTEIGRNYPVTLGILADAKVFLAQLAQEAASRGLSGRRFAPWHELIAGGKCSRGRTST